MSAIAIQQMAERVADMMEERFGVRNKDLSTKLRKGKRYLPRKVAAAAEELAGFAEKSKNPKLLVQIDQARVAAVYDICVRHLSGVKAGGRLKAILINVVATVAFGLLIMGVAVIVLQRIQGRG